jgi:hypothetical protein
MKKKVRIFPIGLVAGETPVEVEEKVNRFLAEKEKEGCQTEIHFTAGYIAIVYRGCPSVKGEE